MKRPDDMPGLGLAGVVLGVGCLVAAYAGVAKDTEMLAGLGAVFALLGGVMLYRMAAT